MLLISIAAAVHDQLDDSESSLYILFCIRSTYEMIERPRLEALPGRKRDGIVELLRTNLPGGLAGADLQGIAREGQHSHFII